MYPRMKLFFRNDDFDSFPIEQIERSFRKPCRPESDLRQALDSKSMNKT